jgi:hypothetical protein
MTDEDPQRAVDIAVAIVDNHLKAGSLGVLNLILGSIDPELLPIGVTLAFLTTSAIAASKLPARAGLVRRFEQSVRGTAEYDDPTTRFQDVVRVFAEAIIECKARGD